MKPSCFLAIALLAAAMPAQPKIPEFSMPSLGDSWREQHQPRFTLGVDTQMTSPASSPDPRPAPSRFQLLSPQALSFTPQPERPRLEAPGLRPDRFTLWNLPLDGFPQRLPVLECERPANLPILRHTPLRHRWLVTPLRESGMGPEAGGVPARGGSTAEVRQMLQHGLRTAVTDHARQHRTPDATCRPVPDVDGWCVNERLAPGASAGRWLPPLNDCNR